MKLQKVPEGWLVEPETSTEQEHLCYLLEGLAARPRENAISVMNSASSVPATRSRSSDKIQGAECETSGSESDGPAGGVNLLYQAQQEARTELPSGSEVEDKSGQETKPPQGRLEGFEMNGDELMFELRGPGGEAWLLYLDGRFEGFPQGTIILNHALPTVNRLLGEMLRPVQGAGGSIFPLERECVAFFREGPVHQVNELIPI